jgi:small subunit ribosomal protein S21
MTFCSYWSRKSSRITEIARLMLDCRFNISSIIKEALWQVWRWDFLAEVRIQEGEPLENALRRFKRKVQQEDIIKEVKRHSYYLKPGEKRRVKAALARKRNRKKARKEQD